MALVKCGECGKMASSKAPACPHCGAPAPFAVATPAPAPRAPVKRAPLPLRILGYTAMVVGGTFAAVFILGPMQESRTPPPAPVKAAAAPLATPAPAPAPPKPCDPKDFDCRTKDAGSAATVYCSKRIERLARYQVRWTDGWLDRRFTRARWMDKEGGPITYIGDAVEFQNGFGAFSPMIYECDLAADEKTVLNVRAFEGRLPAR